MSLTRRFALAAAILGLAAGAAGRAEAGQITFSYGGPSVVPGIPGFTTGVGRFAFDDSRTSLTLGDLTEFGYTQTVLAIIGGRPQQSLFTFGLADLTSFSATLGPGGVPTSLALTTGLVPATNPAFVPETFVVDSLVPDGAATFNPLGLRLTTGTVTIFPATPVPEPSTFALGGIGGLLALGYTWHRRKWAAA